MSQAPQISTDLQTPRVLLLGASGYVGGKLIPRLEATGVRLRCVSRKAEELRHKVKSTTEVVEADVLESATLRRVFEGVRRVYYLVHLMTDSPDFEKEDQAAAKNVADAARAAGVERIIYLGGLGDDNDPNLSPHLRSRHEVGQTLAQSGVKSIEFRASMIVGAGSLSFDLLKGLTERLPVMLCPKWLATPTQPIAIDDILAYLIEAGELQIERSTIFEVGGSDVVTYRQLIEEYARQRNLKRVLIGVPVLSPWLSGQWLRLVTPRLAGVGKHLIEGLRNPTVVRDASARDRFNVRPISSGEAIARALSKAD